MSVATTSRLPSTSSPKVQMSIDKEAKSPQVGINTSVSNIGLPKSKVTNLLAPRVKNTGLPKIPVRANQRRNVPSQTIKPLFIYCSKGVHLKLKIAAQSQNLSLQLAPFEKKNILALT